MQNSRFLCQNGDEYMEFPLRFISNTKLFTKSLWILNLKLHIYMPAFIFCFRFLKGLQPQSILILITHGFRNS